MDESKPTEREPALPLEYRSARGSVRKVAPIPAAPIVEPHEHISLLLTWLKWIGGALALVAIAWCILLEYDSPGAALREQCAQNLKTIATVCIAYSDAHDGKLPANFEEMIHATGVTSDIFVCPATSDTPAEGTSEEQAVALANAGHVSYIWVGKQRSASPSGNTVLAYEPLANHDNAGIHVLFGDYHVEWLEESDARQLIDSIIPGERVVWPVAGSKP